ncbi:FtsX-like permease family protein [bacterium]|nr:FtsX-like permease family protein [bacterium]
MDDQILLKYGDKEFFETGLYLADSTIFRIFTHPFIYGDPNKAFTEPNAIIMTENLARKYFGDTNPINEIVNNADGEAYKVTGVIRDLPGNSHLTFDGLISMATVVKQFGAERFNDNSAGRFWNIQAYTYVLLNENTRMEDIIEKFPAFYDKYMREIGDKLNGSFKLMASNITDIHLTSKLQYELPTGNIAYVYIFIAVAIFILLIACINYMNMATARSSSRAKEVGIRKTAGADRLALVRQFLAESVILAFIALIISVIITPLVLPTFNYLSGRDFSLTVFQDPGLILSVIGITILTGIVAGSYPAFYLSSFEAAGILKGELTRGKKSGTFRKLLVIIQFTISVFMIVGTFTVSRQLHFVRNTDLGFDKENVLVVQLRDTTFIRHKLESFMEEIKRYPGVIGAARSNSIPGGNFGKVVFRVENEGQMEEQALNFMLVDYDYVDMMGLEVTEGRQYDREMGTDMTEAFIVNETAAMRLNWGDSALGKRMQFGIDIDGSAQRDGKVVGLVKDFNFWSLHNPIEPMALIIADRFLGQLSIRLTADKKDETIDFIKTEWGKFGNNRPFNYIYLENKLDEYYADEKKLAAIFSYFSIITIFIACLGLLGLSAFIAERRTKEIGIRKVLGATERNVVWHLAREFILLVVISNIIAQPLAMFALKKWLQNFAYQTTLSVWTFIASFLISLAIALLTVSFQSVKAVLTNPVKALRYE